MITIRKLILPFLLLVTIAAHAQPGAERKDEIESLRVAYLTRRLNLSTEEAQIFWPVFNQYSSETRKLREAHQLKRRAARANWSAVSDKEAAQIIEEEIVFRQQELDLMKKYNPQFMKVLPVKKVALLYTAEEDFKRELLEKMRERRASQPK